MHKDFFFFESESSTKVSWVSSDMEGLFFTFQEMESEKSFEKWGPDLLIIFHAWKNRTEQVKNTRKVKMYFFFF